MNYTTLKEKYDYVVNIKNINNHGNLCIYVERLNVILLRNHYQEFVDYVYLSCLECLKISKTYTVHLYLENATNNNFSFSLFKKLNKKLNTLEDVLYVCYVYHATTITKNIFKLISPFIDKTTKQKILLL